MGYVTSDMTSAMRTNVKAIFMQALGELAAKAPFNDWQKLATEVPSDSDKEEYDWLGASPPLSEWKDKRQLRGLRPYALTLTNQDWEATLEINRNAFSDNKLGHIPMRVRGLTRSYLKGVIKSVFEKLNGGASDAATFDAAYFFHATRTIGDSGTINNIAAGAYAAAESNIRTGFNVALAQMMNFCDDWGTKMGLVPDTVICAPVMYMLIKKALTMPAISGSIPAEAEFVKQIVVSPWLTSGTTAGHDWYIACTTEEIKPVIFQNRQKPEVTSLDKPDDHDNFMAKTLYYGVDARYTVGFADPRTCVQVDCSD